MVIGTNIQCQGIMVSLACIATKNIGAFPKLTTVTLVASIWSITIHKDFDIYLAPNYTGIMVSLDYL